MELKEAFDIIDATLGMFRSIEEEVECGDLKEDFLMTPVYRSIDNVFDADKDGFEMKTIAYYKYVDGDKENKRYIVDIRPVCDYMINEWPSPKAKNIRKLLNEVLLQCVDLCKETLEPILNIALEEGYGYDKYMRTKDSFTLETVMLDTIHEMSHALGLTEYAEPDVQEEDELIYVGDSNRIISEDLASQMNWREETNDFNPYKIVDLVYKIGKSKREKKNVIIAIYDSMLHSDNLSKLPDHIDKLLNDLHRKFDNKHRSIKESYFEEDGGQRFDEISADEIIPVESQNTQEEEHVKELSSQDLFFIKAVEIMKEEKVIKHLYDYAFIMKIMNETKELPTFNSAKSFHNYLEGLKIPGLPGEDSIKKKINATFGNHPSWSFSDDKGKDITEAKRRIAVGCRFLSIIRKGK